MKLLFPTLVSPNNNNLIEFPSTESFCVFAMLEFSRMLFDGIEFLAEKESMMKF